MTRATTGHDDAEARIAGLTYERDALMTAVSAMRDVATWLTAQRDAMRAKVDKLADELATARDIIAGCTTPPTDAEIAAHEAAGGWWLITPDGYEAKVEMDAGLLRRFANEARDPLNPRAVWRPFDGCDNPCAWPVADVSDTAHRGEDR